MKRLPTVLWTLFAFASLFFYFGSIFVWPSAFGLHTTSSTAERLFYGLLVSAIGMCAIWWLAVRPYKKAAVRHLTHFDTMLEKAPDAVLAVDEKGQVVLANQQAHALFGYVAGELIGQSIDLLVPEPFRGAHGGHRQGFHRKPHARRMGTMATLTGQRKDGTAFPVDISLSSFSDEFGTLALAFIRDMSAQRVLWQELAKAKGEVESELHERRRLRAMSELVQTLRSRDEVRSVLNMHLEHLFPGTSGGVFLFSPSRDDVETLVGWGPEAPNDERFLVDECWALRLGKIYGVDATQETIPCPHMSARPHVGEYWCVPMLADGETLGVFHVRSDSGPGKAHARGDEAFAALAAEQRHLAIAVAERLALPLANLRLRETLRDQSIRDALTGVFNRRYMEESLVRELSRAARHQDPVSVAILDLDHFKRLNDAFGHSVGDELLREFGRFLAARFRADDIVCRYGGEEFVLILPASIDEAAAARIDALRSEWGLVTVDNRSGGRVSTSFSAGVAEFPKDGSKADIVIHAADAALYRAKSEGRNRVVVSAALAVCSTT
jgi:diguanylate cyclase (GGDEF)-like protein/PAS domain S-box-containing protein